MKSVHIRSYLKMPVAISRESARSLELVLQEAFQEEKPEVEVDLTGMAGIAPSFLDELLRIIEEAAVGGPWIARFTSPPTEFSSKFRAVSRAHNLTATISDTAWSLASTGSSKAA